MKALHYLLFYLFAFYHYAQPKAIGADYLVSAKFLIVTASSRRIKII